MKRIILLSFLLFCFLLPVKAQEKTISGTVISAEDSTSIPGVSVFVKGSTLGTVTDVNGKYTLTIPSAADSLVFSFMGMDTQTILAGDNLTLNVALRAGGKALSEVVVTALGIRRERKALGYAVQEVSGRDVQVARDPSFINQLSGTVAGLNVSATTGGPGSSSRIVLRGPTSLSGNNQALIVIDGVPMENNTLNTTSQWGGRDYGNGISDINADDIESISVLKGPNAAALYGSMATNGVILITTKKGRTRKGIGVSLNSSTAFEIPNILTKFQNTYGAGRNGNFEGPWELKDGIHTYNSSNGAAFGSWGPKMQGQLIKDWDGQVRSFNPQPQNYRDFYQTGITAANTVSFEGSNERISARLSVGNMNTKDIVPNTTLNRTNISARTIAAITGKLNLNVSVNYINQQANNRLGLSNSFSAPRNYLIMPRHISASSLKNHIMTETGRATTWFTNWNWMSNSYWDIQYELNNDQRNRVIGLISATYDFNSHLSLMLRSNTDFNIQRQNNREAYNGISNSLGAYSNLWSNYHQMQNDFLLTYTNKLDLISFSVNLGGNTFQNKNEFTGINTDGGLAVPYFYSVQNSVNRPQTTYGLSESRINALYAFAQAGYKSWLFVDITGRNDWASALPKENRSYFYPSVSTSFVFTEALNLEKKILSFGKLRISWASVGRATDPYRNTITYSAAGSFNGAPLYQVNPSIPLLNLRPEITSNWEAGTELLFFTGRMGMDLNYYNSRTRNQILPSSISASSGFTSAIINSGEILNQGIEFQLKGKVISKNRFGWDINLNVATNKNKVISLTKDLETYQLFSQWGLTVEARPGYAYGDIVGYGIKRDANGNKLVDAKGMYIRADKPSVLGNYNPKFTGGIQNNFNYRSFSLGILVDYKVGGQMFSGTNMYGNGYAGNLVETLDGREAWYASEAARKNAGKTPDQWIATGGVLAEGVTAEGFSNKVFINPERYWGQFSDWGKEIHEPFVYDACFVKLRQVILNYQLPPSVTAKLKLRGLSIGLTGRNLWLIYSGVPNVDPESAYNNGNGQGYEIYAYPVRRSIGFNLNLNL